MASFSNMVQSKLRLQLGTAACDDKGAPVIFEKGFIIVANVTHVSDNSLALKKIGE